MGRPRIQTLRSVRAAWHLAMLSASPGLKRGHASAAPLTSCPASMGHALLRPLVSPLIASLPRRQLLGSVLMLSGQATALSSMLNPAGAVAATVLTKNENVSAEVPSQASGSTPYGFTPTRVTATGRIIASELRLLSHGEAQGLRRPLCWSIRSLQQQHTFAAPSRLHVQSG